MIQTSPPARPRAAPESGEPSTWDDASLPSAVVAAYLPPTRHPAARARLAAVLAAALLLLAGIFLLVHGL